MRFVDVNSVREREPYLLTTYWSESTQSSSWFWWTGLAPWGVEFPFPGSLTSTFLERRQRASRAVLTLQSTRDAPRRCAESGYTPTGVLTQETVDLPLSCLHGNRRFAFELSPEDVRRQRTRRAVLTAQSTTCAHLPV